MSRFAGIPAAGCARVHGQAMTEFLIGALVLAPLFLGAWRLAGLMDLQAATSQAARYVALDVHRGAGDVVMLGTATRQRIFDGADLPVSVNDASSATAGGWRRYRPLWRDPLDGERWLARPEDVSVALTRRPVAGAARASSDVTFAALAPARALARGDLDPPAAAVHAGVAVDARVPAFAAVLGTSRVPLRAGLWLVTDEWEAAGPRVVEARVDALTPTGWLQQADRLLRPLRIALSVIEPRLRQFCPGRLSVDIVPPDRLSGAQGPGAASEQGVAPC